MKRTIIATSLASLLLGGAALASSHREAPAITKTPKVDATDFYMFRSYEEGRQDTVTFIANYQPLQDAYGGPNYFLMDPEALYTINIDNDGDAVADHTFSFRFYNKQANLTVPAGGVDVAVPLSNIGPFDGTGGAQKGNRNVIEAYAVVVGNDSGMSVARNIRRDGNAFFFKPFDNVGNKSIPDYESYANLHIYEIGFDGCASTGRVFVGQRQDGFAVNLGAIFDLINLNPLGPVDGGQNDLEDKNVTSIALEVPIDCVADGGSPIIGAWTTAWLPDETGSMQSVSRLSAPLVNEVVIGLPDKDKFNASHPIADGQFATYVTNPTLPILIEALFPSVQAPTQYPRTDLVAAFLTGIAGLNQPANVTPAEMMRLNTTVDPRVPERQMTLGVLAGDNGGFPNGRRPGDDVVDIELRVAMGVLLPEEDAPSGQLPFTDGAALDATDFQSTFPYLNTPLPGAVNSAE